MALKICDELITYIKDKLTSTFASKSHTHSALTNSATSRELDFVYDSSTTYHYFRPDTSNNDTLLGSTARPWRTLILHNDGGGLALSDGSSVTVTMTTKELSYLNGVTSSVQTQLNGKAPSSHTHDYSPLGARTGNGSAVLLFDGNEATPSITVSDINQYKYFLVQLQTTGGSSHATWIHVPYCNSYLGGYFRAMGGYETTSASDGARMYFLRGTISDSKISIESCWTRSSATMTTNSSAVQMHVKRVVGVK